MKLTKSMAVAASAVLMMALAACGDDDDGGGGGGDSDHIDVEVADSPDLEAGTPQDLADAGSIRIGVKMDQPGIGLRVPGEDLPTGFDIEIGRILAGGLGIDDDGIEWVETISDNREQFIDDGTVDIVIASYSITDERRELVGQAGPYYVTGQQLLVRQDDAETITSPEDMSGIKVCSVEGSTSLATAEEEYGAQPVPAPVYSDCVDQLQNGTVDAVTTDGAILQGYAAEDPDNLEVVTEPFSEERYGVGYKKGDTAMCEFITSTLQEAMDNDKWAEAFDATLGQAGVEAPDPPEMDPCQ